MLFIASRIKKFTFYCHVRNGICLFHIRFAFARHRLICCALFECLMTALSRFCFAIHS